MKSFEQFMDSLLSRLTEFEFVLLRGAIYLVGAVLIVLILAAKQ